MLAGPTDSRSRTSRPGKAPAATRRNIGATGNVPARAALSRATASMLLPGRLRSRLIVCVMAVMALGAHRGAGQSPPPPCTPGAPASNIATAWCLRLIPAGFGSGRGSVPAKHGPQPASMRAAPAFRERLSDVEAASTGSFSSPCASGDLGL